MIELGSDGHRPELLQCLEGTEGCVLGFNSLLDHSWIGSEPFLAIAEAQERARNAMDFGPPEFALVGLLPIHIDQF